MSIDPLHTLSAPVGGSSFADTPVTAATAKMFSEMIRNAAPIEPEVGIASSVGEALLKQDELFRETIEQHRVLEDKLRNEGASKITTEERIDMMVRANAISVGFTAASNVAQSVRNGIQTLMKNQ